MLTFKSIKTKILTFFITILVVVCLGIGGTSYYISSNTIEEMTDASLTAILEGGAKLIESRMETHFNALEAIAANPLISNPQVPIEEKLNMLDKELERSGHLRIGIGDFNGHLQYTNGNTADVGERASYQMALKGTSAVNDPTVSKLDGSIVFPIYVPIFDDREQVIGVLAAIRDGSELSHLVSDIGYGKTGQGYLVNNQGTIIADRDVSLVLDQYNVFDVAQKDPAYQPYADVIQKAVKGESGIGEYAYENIPKYVAYEPVPKTSWSIIISVERSEIMQNVNILTKVILIISAAFLIGGILIAVFISSSITKPIRMTAQHLEVMATGDFTQPIPESLLKMSDETGTLANAASDLQSSMKEIIVKVMEESNRVGQTLATINREMERLDGSIEEIAATTEQLSAGSQQTAASAEEMNATSTEIERAVEAIATKAQDGSVVVGNVSTMAEEMSSSALESRKNALAMYENTKEALQKAIQQSQEVNQINELSDSILEITAQTNLLSLNASIEAARAGEAGKGFAVVANEIRGLADSSKETVSRIQEVTKVILEAVSNLAAHSNEILDFVDQKVLSDYEYFVQTSEQSSENTMSIGDMVTDFSAASEELLASIQNMVNAINEVSLSSNEAANGTTSIAQESTTIAQMSNEITALSEEAKQRSDTLIAIVTKFKV